MAADKLKWERVKEVHETEHGFYFSLSPGGFRIIPRPSNEQAAKLGPIRDLLRARLDRRAHLSVKAERDAL